MKRRCSILALVLAAVVPMAAQLVASHASTSTVSPQAANTTTLQPPVGKPVVRINGAVLTDRDLMREMFTIFPYARQHNGGVPKAMEADIRKGAMDMLIFEELVYQEALRRKMTVSPARMQKAEADFRKQFRSPDDYKVFMQGEVQGSHELLRTKIRRSLLIDDMLKTQIENRSAVSLAEAKAYFDKNPDRFRNPESFALQTISVLPPANATPTQLKDLRKRAEDGLKQAKATKNYEDFGVLAEKISEDDWRVMMGDHKAVDVTTLPPEVVKAARAMQPGQISDLVEVGGAYTIIRLNAHIPAGMQKFEAIQDSLRKQLQRNKTEELRAALDKRLRKNAKVEEL